MTVQDTGFGNWAAATTAWQNLVCGTPNIANQTERNHLRLGSAGRGQGAEGADSAGSLECRQGAAESLYMAGSRSKLAVELLPKVSLNLHPGGWHEPNGQPDQAHHDRARRALPQV